MPSGLSPIDCPPFDLSASQNALQQLLFRPLPDRPALAQWIDDWSVCYDRLEEARIRREIAKDQAQNDQAVQQRHQDWIDRIGPALAPLLAQFHQRLATHPLINQLAPCYHRLVQQAAAQTDLYHPQNKTSIAACQHLVDQYYQMRGDQQESCDWPHPDRGRRQSTFKAQEQRRHRDGEQLDELVGQLLGHRQQMAENAGQVDFRAYRFVEMQRTAYSPQDCLGWATAVEEAALPLLHRLDRARTQRLQLQRLKPWDVRAEPATNAGPMRPFDNFADLLEGLRPILHKLHPRFAADLNLLRQRQLLDIEPRPGKAAFVGYQQVLRQEGLPFLFVNVKPTPDSARNLLHELGHASHTLACRHQRPTWNRDVPLEFGETVANTFQLIGGGLLAGHLLPPASDAPARAEQLEGLVDNLVYTARGEQMLHWLHTHPGHTPDERAAYWLALCQRLDRQVDWSGLEHFRARSWLYEIPHFFFAPFYWIEYLIGQWGALQLWQRFRRDPEEAMAGLYRAMQLGHSVPLPELFSSAGISLYPSRQSLVQVLAAVEAEWQDLMKPEDP
ncbi:MAG: hypothetical protein GKR89_16030 [Candidatus Latescibacteria bacterium]|nr:hypothetical protein [Candidatus Latescibacterota bacterium]